MRIQNFEDQIDERILARGHQYFAQGKLSALQNEGNRYRVIAHGTEDYQVEATVDENGEIIHSSCDCPYDDGDYCKHEAALFYAIREQRFSTKQKEGVSFKGTWERPIGELVQSMPRKQMEDLVLKLVDRFDDVEDQVRFRASNDEEKLRVAKQLIQFHIIHSRHNGFIEASDSEKAMEGVTIVFDEALHCEKMETGIALCLIGLDEIVNMDGIDDSYGAITQMLSTGQETIVQLLAERLETSSKPERKSVFRLIMKYLEKHWADDLAFSGGSLMETLLLFCNDPEFATQYESFLLKKKAEAINKLDLYDRKYYLDRTDMLMLHLLDYTKDTVRRQTFIASHLDNPEIRVIAIKESINEGNYERALELINAGILLDKAFPGIVSDWYHLAFQVHQKLNHIDKVRELSAKFLIKGEKDFYEPYLSTFPPEEHENAVNAILKKFEQETYATDTYISILIDEKRYEKLMILCETTPSLIEDLYIHLLKSYPDRVDECFKRHIREKAADSTQRSDYKRVCQSIKIYRKAFGEEYAANIVEELQKKYPRRPAMMDELNRITVMGRKRNININVN